MNKQKLNIPVVVPGVIGNSFYKRAIEFMMQVDEAKARLRAYTNSQETVDRIHEKILHLCTTTRTSYVLVIIPIFEKCIEEVSQGKPISFLEEK